MLRRATTCRHVRNLLPLHVGGDLPARQAGPVEEHLGTCLPCFREFHELTLMRGRIGVLTEQPLPEGVLEGFAEEIMARIAVGEPGPRAELLAAMERARLWPRYAAAAALLVTAGLTLHGAGAWGVAPAGPTAMDGALAEAAPAAWDEPAASWDEPTVSWDDPGPAVAAADDLGIFAPPVDDEGSRPLARPPVYDGSRARLRPDAAVVSESIGPRGSDPHAMPTFTEGARVLVDAAGSRVVLVLPQGGGLQEESGREKRLREP